MNAMLKSFIITSLFTFSSLFVFAQDVEKDIIITASGRGKSKEDAKRAALKSTIDQVIDVFFPSKLELLKDQFIKDDDNNSQYITFLNMVGHYFDNIWIFLQAVTDINLANNNLEQGEDYAENMFMQYASDELKQQYNEYYGYIEGDEFLL